MAQKAKKAIPEGMNTVTPYLTFKGGKCAEALEFYKSALGAQMLFPPMKSPDGSIMHAMMKIGDSQIMMSDSFINDNESAVGSMASFWLYTENCDELFNRAVKAGAKVTMAMEDQFWGDRVGEVEDPFGFRWSIASQIWELSPEEIQQRQEEWMKKMGG